jgi:hypothetical protein
VFLVLTAACGRRGDPVAIIPYEEVGVATKVKAVKKDGDILISWKMPDKSDFPAKAIKGFSIFRAEVPAGKTLENCECQFRHLDFITPDNLPELSKAVMQEPARAEKDIGKAFQYIDKKTRKGISYAYKIVVMDKKSRMGEASYTVFVTGARPVPQKTKTVMPAAPTGLIALYTQKSVVLTWDEATDQEIKFYRIYRSEGEHFSLIGKAVTPAFTDTNIESSKKYFYKISAFGDIEGPLSEETGIVTEKR